MQLKNTSATQVTMFMRCPRRWYYAYVKGFKEPATPAMQFGTKLHANNENYLNGKELSFDHKDAEQRRLQRLFELGKKYLPEPGSPGVLVEKKISIPTRSGLPWIGFVDLAQYACSPVLETDYKTSSDFRYNKTVQELLDDPQMLSYAIWGFEEFGVDEIQARHLYYRSKGTPLVVPGPTVTFTKENTEKRWNFFLDLVEEMEAWAAKEPENADPLKANTNDCNAFNKECFHKKRCNPLGVVTMSDMLDMWKKNGAGKPVGNTKEAPKVTAPEPEVEAATEEDEVAKAERLLAEAKAKREAKLKAEAEAKEKAEAEAKEKAAAKAQSVLPPDAPDRNEKPPTQSEESKPRKRKTAKKKTKGTNLTLYIDCAPLKGDCDFVMFEDFVLPIMDQLAEQSGVPDIRFIDFAKWKGPLAASIREIKKEDLPSNLVMSSFAAGYQEAVSVLVPIADYVVKKT